MRDISPAPEEKIRTVGGARKYLSIGTLPELAMCSCGCGKEVMVRPIYFSAACAKRNKE